ncbi:SigB/SigF/SigG family RNA polymerase sigma factor [bacterium]|nr:MAG: SigB/SigF/SigG family RNA polymerase sigma factor [bacterium]
MTWSIAATKVRVSFCAWSSALQAQHRGTGVSRTAASEEQRWDRERARAAFARFSELRKLLGTRSGRGAQHDEYERLRSELVVMHLNLVRYLAVKFANRGETLDDLIQVGTVGLIKAIDRFDLERKVEFTTYATPTIVGEIKRYFRDKGWAVKVPRRLQELNLAVNRAVEMLTSKLNRSPTVSDLAEHLEVSDEQILEAQELGQAYNVLSLDTELGGENEKKSATLLDYLGAEDIGLAQTEDRANLERAFEALSRRERLILYLRFYQNVSQTEIARRLNVSQMHISRLQQKALEKLKGILGEE